MMKVYDSGSKYGYMEELGSKMANLLKLPVVYNKTFKDGSIHYGLSIDFMKYDKSLRYGTMQGDYFTAPYDSHKDYEYENWVNFFENKILKDRHTGRFLNDSHRLQILRGFTPAYFFRKYVLEDPDFDLQNMCIIYDDTAKKYCFGPNYDMERAYCEERKPYLYEYTLQRDLELAYQIFPDVMQNFMQRLEYVDSNNLVTKDMFSHIKSPILRKKIMSRVKENISAIARQNKIVQSKIREGM